MLAIALASSVSVLPATADDDAPPGGYPSWQDVQNAKQSEAGKAAEIAKIDDLLGGLQSQAEVLGNAAVKSAAEYAVAESALQVASSKVDVLTAQTARANAELGQYRREIGALAAQSYKTGGTNMGFFVALDAVQTNSIQGLNIVQIVSDKTAALVNKSAAAEKASRAFAEQEQAAKAERERLSGEAKAKLEAAQSAQQAMARQIAAQQQHSQELTAQLASLKGTTAAVEDEYRQGQAALAAYEAAQAAKRAAAEEQARRQAEAAKAAALAAAQLPANPAPAAPAPAAPVAPAPGPTPGPPPVVVAPSIPGGAVNDPAGAKSYAAGRLSAFDWGQDQFQCLAQLWTKESNWLTTATNPYSGAYGIAQALPPGKYATAGSDWLTSYRTQVNWGLSYIADRYGSPCAAWSHSVATNWY
ncbi:lytic transglycosylase domain-containing protein [Arthrobacter pascens]|uniref:aggregation-promoting factor C-terminal-like domain-containing protein n=1 Tax=Arthrobacter pascens TaxID=1677 RepID=UPI0027D83A61|nr:lytic transglycosylase domain-containing protein [Arthrobacter pascens]